jgi:glycosyltransferase involved in cell wall biosynthesis
VIALKTAESGKIKTLKKDLIIVGAFPNKGSTIVGGVVFNCKVLLDYGPFEKFNIIPFDSTQKTNPPPNIIIRLFYSIARFFEFILFTYKHQQSCILVMAALQASWIEKLFMCGVGRLFNCKTGFYPLGGQIIDDLSKSKIQRTVFRCLIKIPDLLLCQGYNWSNFFITTLEVPKYKLKILPSWTATPELLHFGNERCKLRVSPLNTSKPFTILFVGWLEAEKGLVELTNAFIKFQSCYSNSQLLLVGDGHLSKLIESKINLSQNNSSIKILGWKSHDEVIDYYINSDLFILPSYNEGIPNSMIEAMCCKVPTVATTVGAIPTYVNHLEHAYLIRPKSEEDIYQAFVYAIDNYSDLSSMADNAYAMVSKKFSPKVLGDNLSAIYGI